MKALIVTVVRKSRTVETPLCIRATPTFSFKLIKYINFTYLEEQWTSCRTGKASSNWQWWIKTRGYWLKFFLRMTVQIQTIVECFTVVFFVILDWLVVISVSVYKLPKCDDSSASYWGIHYCKSNFRVCEWNVEVFRTKKQKRRRANSIFISYFASGINDNATMWSLFAIFGDFRHQLIQQCHLQD